jgi:hypothetical protein
MADRFITSLMALLRGIKLLICDMAGTVVEEGGLVYQTLRKVGSAAPLFLDPQRVSDAPPPLCLLPKAMVASGLEVSEADMEPWHGAQKIEVRRHVEATRGSPA